MKVFPSRGSMPARKWLRSAALRERLKRYASGAVRRETQVEILAGDGFKLGVKAPVRLSGDLDGTPGITLVGPKGSVQTEKGVMVAQRHIHMLPG